MIKTNKRVLTQELGTLNVESGNALSFFDDLEM